MMVDSATRTRLALVPCNTTDQCASMEAGATCADHLCVCPSFQPLTEARRCNTTDSNLRLALGRNCSVSAQCSHMAACLDGRCDCPQGYQPSDERHCQVIRQSALSVTSWMAIMILTSGFLFILLLIVYVYVLAHQRRPVYVQTSTAPTPSIFVVPVKTTGPEYEALDSFRISTELGARGSSSRSSSYPGAVESWQARLTSTGNETPSVSEHSYQHHPQSRSYALQARSGNERWIEYPLLQNIMTPSYSRFDKGRQKHSTASEKGKATRKRKSNISSSLPDMKDHLRREDDSSIRGQHAITPPETDRHHGRNAITTDESVAAQPESRANWSGEVVHSTETWGSIGRSLDSLLSIPVVARVYTCSSRTQTSLESEKDLVFQANKT